MDEEPVWISGDLEDDVTIWSKKSRSEELILKPFFGDSGTSKVLLKSSRLSSDKSSTTEDTYKWLVSI